jgi:hypothetical protein
MAPWTTFAGLAIAPFSVVLFSWLIGQPVNRLIRERMRDSRIKRFLLLDKDKQPWEYGVPAVIIIVGLYAGIVWASWP